ncbi:magnesium and cobalt transporter [Streptococcus pneumoniae]|nr:magnesium and cobalt transporter [Streptococcus pneumoniae]
MKQVFLSTTTEFKEIDTLEPGTWINLVNPTQNESLEIANTFDIILPTFEHRSMRKKCLVLPLKTSIP